MEVGRSELRVAVGVGEFQLADGAAKCGSGGDCLEQRADALPALGSNLAELEGVVERAQGPAERRSRVGILVSLREDIMQKLGRESRQAVDAWFSSLLQRRGKVRARCQLGRPRTDA
jgi:hypothetical protein